MSSLVDHLHEIFVVTDAGKPVIVTTHNESHPIGLAARQSARIVAARPSTICSLIPLLSRCR